MNYLASHLSGIDFAPWQIVGYLGALMFSSRWVIQIVASRRAAKPVVPTAFWLVSIVGNLFLLAYFIFGVSDAVGIVSNIFPLGIATFNLSLDIKNRLKQKTFPEGMPPEKIL